MWNYLLLTCLQFFLYTAEDISNVVTLTTANFTETINNYEIAFLELYAPWCGHCKALAPEYELVGNYFSGDKRVLIAKMDADAEKETSFVQAFGIAGYPTLKYRKKSFGKQQLMKDNDPTTVTWYDYEKGRTFEEIKSHINDVLEDNWKPEGDPVLELTDENFEKTVSQQKLIVVEFYAPWCGHCKALAPHYKAAAKLLSQMIQEPTEDTEDPYTIVLAKIDATQHKTMANAYNVTGYPTIKIFRRGEPEPTPYQGPRDSAENIVKYLLNQVGHGSKEFSTLKNMKSLLAPEEITIIGFFESHEEPRFIEYLKACSSLRDDFKFLHTFEKEVVNSMKAPLNSVILYQPEKFQSKYERLRYIYPEDEPLTSEALNTFAQKWQRPLVGHMTRQNRATVYMTLPLCVVFYGVDWTHEHIQDTQFWRNKVLEVAKDYQPNINFAIADETEFVDELKKLKLDDTGEEVSAACYTQSKRVRMEPQEFEVDAYRKFIQDFQDGKLEPVIWSQPAPSAESNSLAPVKVVVASTFKTFFTSPDYHNKLILMEFYAPWCGHCKKLEPIYNKLGKHYQNDDRIIISKYDAANNDIDKNIVDIKGYPTLLLFLPPHINLNSNLITYEGKRELEDLKAFIEEAYTNHTLAQATEAPHFDKIEL